MSKDDVWEDPEWKAYAEHAEQTLAPMLRDSLVTVTLFNGRIDAKLAIETGYAVLLDKPFILLTTTGVKVPGNLERLAHHIIFVNDPKDVSQPRVVKEIKAALKEILDQEVKQ